MAVSDNTYSRVVSWLKILLPLLALAILSTLFLVARTVDPAQDLPFADIDVDELAREQRIGRPKYTGVTDDGASISISAESAKPDADNPEKLRGSGIDAGIDLPSGERVKIVAKEMRLDNETGVAILEGGVEITTSRDLMLRTAELEIALDSTRVESREPTQVTAPIGRLSSDSFRLTGMGNADQPYVLVFKGHVKLVYDPNE